MIFAPSSSFAKSRVKARSFSPTMLLGCLAISILLAIVVVLEARSPGLSPGEFASRLNAFP